MSTYDLSNLAPSDAEVALRSFPRRFAQVLRPIGDEDAIDELASQSGPDGTSALDLVGALVARWAVQRQALHELLIADAPRVDPAAIDPSLPAAVGAGAATGVESALAAVGQEAEALAAAVGDTSTSGWTRTGTTGSGATTTSLDVVRAAVRAGRDTLDAVQRTLAAVRAR
jgi:hypothetical protein